MRRLVWNIMGTLLAVLLLPVVPVLFILWILLAGRCSMVEWILLVILIAGMVFTLYVIGGQ